MPHIENELSNLSSFRYIAIFDLSHGYWPLQLSKCLQEFQSLINPDGIYSPTRVLHGKTNVVIYLQSTLAAFLPGDLHPFVLWLLNDIHIYTPTIDKLFSVYPACSRFKFSTI